MKLICLDRELCGISCRIGSVDASYFRTNTCPECYGPAAIVEPNYIPLNQEEIDELIAITTNKINKFSKANEK